MSADIKVLSLVSYRFLPAKMGGQKGIALFNRYLASTLSLTCATTTANETTGNEGYTILPVMGQSKWRYISLPLFFKLRKIIKQEGFTHLILEHPYYGWLGTLLKWATGIKLIVHSHNIESHRFKSMNKWWWGILWNYEKFTHRRADHNFFIHDDDRNYAILHFGLKAENCTTITYGFEMQAPPSKNERSVAKKILCEKHGIAENARIMLFNGTLDYLPNQEALNNILEQINPLLLSSGISYHILICGNRLPEKYHLLEEYRDRYITYAGFVEDINLYFKGADIFLNPVKEGGGIKTKVVEALGNDLSVISTKNGAIGIPLEITGGKLLLVENDDWQGFLKAATKADIQKTIPSAYFDHFFWGHIAAKAKAVIVIT